MELKGQFAQKNFGEIPALGANPYNVPKGRYEPKPEDKVTVGKTVAMRDDWYDTVTEGLGDRTDDKSRRLVGALAREKKKTTPPPQAMGKNVIADQDLEQIFPKDLPRDLVARTANALGKPLDETAVDVRDDYIRHVNHKPWQTIERKITEPGGAKLTSRLLPVNEEYDATYQKYGKTGLGSMSGRLTPEKRNLEECTRPINLWKTSLEDQHQKPLFEAFRSGAFVDTSRDDKQQQANANARGKGVLEAVLIDRLKKLSPVERARFTHGGDTYKGDMVSIDLLSGAGFDKGLSAEHHAVMERLSNQIMAYDISMDGKPCQVNAKFDIADFSTGVNGMNTNLGPAPAMGLSSSSSDQKKANQGSWAKLRQRVKIFNQANGGDTDPEMLKKLAKINALTRSIEELGLGESGSYQLPAMLANLAYQLDDAVHFNCKSGKDRTGIMDSESKFMARQLDKKHPSNVEVPNVATPRQRSPGENYEHDQMMWESGSLDILAKNVGGQCLKTADLATAPIFNKLDTSDAKLAQNLGGMEQLNELGGLKRYADIDTIATFEKKKPWGISKLGKKKKQAYVDRAEEYMNHLPPPVPKKLTNAVKGPQPKGPGLWLGEDRRDPTAPALMPGQGLNPFHGAANDAPSPRLVPPIRRRLSPQPQQTPPRQNAPEKKTLPKGVPPNAFTYQ